MISSKFENRAEALAKQGGAAFPFDIKTAAAHAVYGFNRAWHQPIAKQQGVAMSAD